MIILYSLVVSVKFLRALSGTYTCIGTQRHVGRRGSALGSKELDGSTTIVEGKPLKRGPPCYVSHEVSSFGEAFCWCQVLSRATHRTLFFRNKCGFRSQVLLRDLPLMM